jgi:hypothetical protein
MGCSKINYTMSLFVTKKLFNTMKTLKSLIWLSALSCLLLSCEEETVYSVDPALNPFVDSFYQEASTRGKTLQKSNLLVQFRTSVQAYTSIENGEGQKAIYFNQSAFNDFKNSGNDFLIEAEVYKAMAPILVGKNLTEYTQSNKQAKLDELF